MNTYITLNITLAEMNLKEVEDYLQKALGEPSFIGVSEGETGRTLVVQYKDAKSVLCKLYRLAHELQQDYITYRIQDGNVLEKGVVGDYAYAYAYNYNDFVVASTNLLGCSGVPLQPTQVQTYTKAEQVKQAYYAAKWDNNFSSEGCYREAVSTAVSLGGIEIDNSNEGNRIKSFAPTRTFKFDDSSRAYVTYGGVFSY